MADRDENDWSDLVVPSSPKPSTLGEGTPVITPEVRAERRRLRQAWNRRPRGQRARIALQDVASAFPIIGSRIEPNLEERSEFAEASPISRGIGRAAIHTMPYLAAGVGLPALFSSLPRAALTGATIEGTDAATRGQDILPAAISGGLSAVPGNLLGRAITPLPRGRALELQTDQSVNALRAAAAGLRAQTRRSSRGRFLSREAQEEARRAAEDAANPSARLGRLPDTATGRLEQMARWGLAGGSVGTLIGRPLEGALIGGLAPVAARAATRAGNAAISGANRVLETAPGRAATRAGRRYMSNTAISDEMRALINAIGMPLVQESKQLRDILGP